MDKQVCKDCKVWMEPLGLDWSGNNRHLCLKCETLFIDIHESFPSGGEVGEKE